MKIEIWSDVICPWCGIGNARLDRALSQFEHREGVEVIHRSFQLDPSFPAGQTMPVREMLQKKYGMSDTQLRATGEKLSALAAAEGFTPYRTSDNRVGNTRMTHELLAMATAAGKADEAWRRLYRAYFSEAQDIFSLEALIEIGASLGLEAGEVREALTSGKWRAQVEQDNQEARRLGATGVPFVAIDRRLGVSGAQPVEVFLGALRQGWKVAEGKSAS